MNNISISASDEIVIKLLHYFITEAGYHPIILHGAKDEIWLENLDNDYKIVRIVSNYIHNDEQLNFDLYKTKQIVKKIKRKTLSRNMNTLNFFVNLGDNVHIENENCIYVKKEKDLEKSDIIMNYFPNILGKLKFKEEGINLFMKITEDINKISDAESKKTEEVFNNKTPYLTYIILIINVLAFLAMYILGKGSTDVNTLFKFGAIYKPSVINGEYIRLFTSIFLHIGLVHLVFNCYSIYIIGPQIESFFGKVKYVIIYLLSGAIGSLFSCLFLDGISAGASGSIFGLLGALLYFGYHYRIYLGNVLKSQIIPLIIFNLFLGFMVSGINVWAHIGGLIGGFLVSMAVGVKYKSTKTDKVNGVILSLIFIAFSLFLLYK